MKTKVLLTFILAFLFAAPGMAQKKIVVNQDTLVAISPKDLKTLNGIIEDREWLKREVQWKDSLLVLDSVNLSLKDSLIMGIEAREAKKEEYYINQAKDLNKSLQKEKKKNKRTLPLTIGGALLGLLIGLLL